MSWVLSVGKVGMRSDVLQVWAMHAWTKAKILEIVYYDQGNINGYSGWVENWYSYELIMEVLHTKVSRLLILENCWE